MSHRSLIWFLTCSVSSVVEINGKGAWLMLSLPWRRGTVLVVGVRVVVVDILPSQHGRAWWTAHRRSYKGICERGSTVLHDLPGFVHHLQWAWHTKPDKCKFSYACLRSSNLLHVLIFTMLSKVVLDVEKDPCSSVAMQRLVVVPGLRPLSSQMSEGSH